MSERRVMVLSIIGITLLVYANSLFNGFAYDDTWIVAQNTRVHQLTDLRAILLTPYWPSFGSELGLYRPFTILAFAVEWAIGGGAPWVFHLANVLLHAGVSVLVFLVVEQLLSRRAAIAAAILFAVHPLHTEAVANVVGQGELWAALGVLTACYIYITRPDGAALDARRRVLLFGLYGASLMFKESAVVLPGLLVLLDVAQGRVRFGNVPARPNAASPLRYAKEMAFPIAVFTTILLAFLVLRLEVLGNVTGTDAAPGLPHLREQFRVLNAFRAWPEFMRLLFVPFDLSVDYAPGLVLPVESITAMVALGMLLVVACVALMLVTPRFPQFGLPAGWFIITILPVSNFFFPIGVLIAERTLYLPSFAVCFLAGYAWQEAGKLAVRESRRLAIGFAFLITIVFSGFTIKRNPDWDSLQSVWDSLARDHPESYRAQWLKAIDLWSKGQYPLAEQYFLLANRIWPRDSQLLKEFGNFYIGQRRYDKAIELLERSRDMTPFIPQTWQLLAYAYLYGDRPAEALAAAQHATVLESTQASLTYPLMGGAYYELGRYGESAGAWRLATQTPRGDLWLNWAMLARALAAAGFERDARQAVEQAMIRTGKEPSLQNVVRRLEEAIASNCYPAGSNCDPLEGWAITAGSPRPKAGK